MQKVEIGRVLSEFPGQTWNDLVDAAEASLKQAQRPAQSVTAPSLPPVPSGASGSICARIRNISGAACAVFSVLGCGDPVDKPATPEEGAEDSGNQFRRPIVDATIPVTATHGTKFVILQHGVPAQGNADGLRIGFTWVKVYFTSSSHTHAKIKDSDTTQLESASSGAAEIWWHETLPEELPATRWALVLLGAGGGGSSDVNLKFGVLTSALSAAEGFGTPGEGTVQEKDLATGDDIGGERDIKNPLFSGVLNNYCVWFLEKDGDLYLVKPDCTEAP